MFERFTDRARKVMALANQEAQRANHEYIGTEHILLGLIKEGSGVGANVLKNLEIDLHKVRTEVEMVVKKGSAAPTAGKYPQTQRAKNVIEYAIREARALDHNYVGTEHLLLGLLCEKDGVAAHVLVNLGASLADVREEVVNLLGAGDPNTELSRAIPSPTESSVSEADQVSLIQMLLSRFDAEIIELTRLKDECVRKADYEKATQLRDELLAVVEIKTDAMRIMLRAQPPVSGTVMTKNLFSRLMICRMAVALLESSPDLASRLGDAIEKIRRAAEEP